MSATASASVRTISTASSTVAPSSTAAYSDFISPPAVSGGYFSSCWMRAESDPGSPCSTACARSFGTESEQVGSVVGIELLDDAGGDRRRTAVSRISIRVAGETRVMTVAAMAGSSSVKTCRRESARGSAFNSSARSAGCSAATAVAIACAPDASTSATSGSIPSTVEGPSGVCALMIDPQGCEWSGTVARFESRVRGAAVDLSRRQLAGAEPGATADGYGAFRRDPFVRVWARASDAGPVFRPRARLLL